MDKKELKTLLRPLVKEIISEVLMEVGVKSLVSEIKQPVVEKQTPEAKFRKAVIPQRKGDSPAYSDTKKRMDEELKRAGILSKSFNPFDGTKPLTESQAADSQVPSNPNSIDPNDPGIDITGIMNMASGRWAAHMSGKKK
jgi:hypothetical protein